MANTQYDKLKALAQFHTNTFVIKVKNTAPGAQSGPGVSELFTWWTTTQPNNTLSAAVGVVITWLKSLQGNSRQDTVADRVVSNIEANAAIVGASLGTDSKSVQVTCSSLHTKRILKRFVNNNPMWHPPMSSSNQLVSHHLHAVDVPLSSEHKLYHKIVRAFRAEFGKQIGSRFSSIWLHPVAYRLNKPVLLPRITFIWAPQSTSSIGTLDRGTTSLTLHPGFRNDVIFQKRSGASGNTLQLQARLSTFPFLGKRVPDRMRGVNALVAITQGALEEVEGCLSPSFILPRPTQLAEAPSSDLPSAQPSPPHRADLTPSLSHTLPAHSQTSPIPVTHGPSPYSVAFPPLTSSNSEPNELSIPRHPPHSSPPLSTPNLPYLSPGSPCPQKCNSNSPKLQLVQSLQTSPISITSNEPNYTPMDDTPPIALRTRNKKRMCNNSVRPRRQLTIGDYFFPVRS